MHYQQCPTQLLHQRLSPSRQGCLKLLVHQSLSTSRLQQQRPVVCPTSSASRQLQERRVSAPTPAVFPLSPDASDLSSPEDVYHDLLGLVPVKVENLFANAECAAHGLPGGCRDGLVGTPSGCINERVRRGYAWRQRRRAQQLYSLRAACVPPCDAVDEALRCFGGSAICAGNHETAILDLEQELLRVFQSGMHKQLFLELQRVRSTKGPRTG